MLRDVETRHIPANTVGHGPVFCELLGLGELLAKVSASSGEFKRKGGDQTHPTNAVAARSGPVLLAGEIDIGADSERVVALYDDEDEMDADDSGLDDDGDRKERMRMLRGKRLVTNFLAACCYDGLPFTDGAPFLQFYFDEVCSMPFTRATRACACEGADTTRRRPRASVLFRRVMLGLFSPGGGARLLTHRTSCHVRLSFVDAGGDGQGVPPRAAPGRPRAGAQGHAGLLRAGMGCVVRAVLLLCRQWGTLRRSRIFLSLSHMF